MPGRPATHMADSQVSRTSSKDRIFARPQDLPEDWYRLWESLITDMRREAQALPMNTMMSLLMERIATNYVLVKRYENRPARELDWEQHRQLQKLWLTFLTEFSTQLHRNSQTPEQRFVAEFKAAITGALRTVGPDASVRDLMPVLAEALRDFGI